MELSKSQEAKDLEYNELRQKLSEKLQQAQQEEARYLELANQLEQELGRTRQELEIKTYQLNDVRRSVQEISSSRCIQLVCAQEEVNNLKSQLNNLLNKHCALNVENQNLHSQSTQFQTTIKALEGQSQLLKEQLEEYLAKLHTMQCDKKTLVDKNRELLNELRLLQSSYATVNKQQREVQYQTTPKVKNTCKANLAPPYAKCHSPEHCQSPWSLGSQGTASVIDEDTPPTSPYPNDMSDWYSSTFRNDSEEESEEDWVTKLEHLTCQVRRTNTMWEHEKRTDNVDYGVSRDQQK